MKFLKFGILLRSSFLFLIILTLLFLVEVSTMSPQNWTNYKETGTANVKPQDKFETRAMDSRPHRQEYESSPFLKSHWTIWDRPEDQLAVEEGGNASPGLIGDIRRRKKQYHNGTNYRSTPKVSANLKYPLASSIHYSSDNRGTQRQGCNSNLQVSFFPVILVLIAAIAGLITIVIVWLIARKWTDFGTNSTGQSHQYGTGWSRDGRVITTDVFSRVLKNLDFDQLTNLVMNGIEAYRKYVDKS